MKFIKKNWLIIFIIFAGVFLRSIKFQQFFMYNHDHDLEGWIVRDILENGHLRLIGQETTNQGVFIGALWYYLLIPFYLITNWDPIGTVALPIIVSAISIWSIYFVFSRVFDKRTGLISAAIYSFSYYTVFTDREVVPTTPVMLWTIWFFYALFQIYKGKQKTGFILAAILAALIWHLNLALAIVLPLALVSLYFSKKKINFKYLGLAVIVAVVLSLPLIIFEIKHGFIQINAIYQSITTDKTYIEGTSKGFAKLDRVMQLVYKNTKGIFFNSIDQINEKIPFLLLLFASGYLLVKKKLDLKLSAVMILWLGLFVAFFTLNPINISEYYINGMNVIWIALASLFLSKFLNKYLSLALLFVFLMLNLFHIINTPVNASGYIQRKAVADFIKQDASAHNYPCVAISYITEPGYDLGYRYFFFLNNLKTKPPSSMAPVYTIVFPHSKVDRIDKSFGALGLVLPDYERYNESSVETSCEGENDNLTYPMFGFTK